MLQGLGPPNPVPDVPGDAAHRHHFAVLVTHGEQRNRNIQRASIAGQPLCFEHLALAGYLRPQGRSHLSRHALRLNPLQTGFTNHLLRAIAVHPGRAAVPAQHGPIQGTADDGVVRGFHERRQPRALQVRQHALRRVAEDVSHADRRARFVQHVRTLDVRGEARPILAHQRDIEDSLALFAFVRLAGPNASRHVLAGHIEHHDQARFIQQGVGVDSPGDVIPGVAQQRKRHLVHVTHAQRRDAYLDECFRQMLPQLLHLRPELLGARFQLGDSRSRLVRRPASLGQLSRRAMHSHHPAILGR